MVWTAAVLVCKTAHSLLHLSSLVSTWCPWWSSSSASLPSTPCLHPLSKLSTPAPPPPPSVMKDTTIPWPLTMTRPAHTWPWESALGRRAMKERSRGVERRRKRRRGRETELRDCVSEEGTKMLLKAALKCEHCVICIFKHLFIVCLCIIFFSTCSRKNIWYEKRRNTNKNKLLFIISPIILLFGRSSLTQTKQHVQLKGEVMWNSWLVPDFLTAVEGTTLYYCITNKYTVTIVKLC